MNERRLITVVSMAGVLLVSGSAAAWETRVLTLGDQNRFIEDDANIWLYPQKLLKYGDRFYLDLARKEGRVVDSQGEGEGLEAIQDMNGGFFIEATENLHLAFWATQYTDMTMNAFLNGTQAAQQNPENCAGLVQEDGNAPPSNNCRMSGQEIVGDDYRGQYGGFTHGDNRKLDMFLGWKLAPNFDMGAHLWLGSGKWAYVNDRAISEDKKHYDGESGGSALTDLLYETMNFGIGLGASMNLWADGDLDLGIRFAHYKYDLYDKEVVKPSVDGGNVFALDTRLTTRLSKHWWLTPALQVDYKGFGGLVDVNTSPGDSSGIGNNTSTIDWKSINFDLGLGLQMRTAGKGTLFTSFGIDYKLDEFKAQSDWGADHTISVDTLQLPYWRTGFEAPLFSWLDLRGGVIKRWGSIHVMDDFLDPGNTTVDTDKEAYRRRASATREYTYSMDEENRAALAQLGYVAPMDFETFVGTTMHHEGWYFTTELDPNFLFYGPFNNVANKPWFARFEISYRY